MKSRWSRLFQAIKCWWRNEPPLVLDLTPLTQVRKLLNDYSDLYGQRVQLDPSLTNQAAEIVEREGHKRRPGIESEVRVLAIAIERLLAQMEQDFLTRQREKERCSSTSSTSLTSVTR